MRARIDLRRFLFSASLLALLSVPALAAGGEKAAAIVVVADQRNLSGWQLWLADLYNYSLLQFALFTIVAVPLMGVILGVLADFVMKRIGIDLTKRELAEH